MKRFKEWWYILKVCHKYSIRLWPFSGIGCGTYWSHNLWLKGPTIRVNPFDPQLMEIFLHEVGHHIADRVGYEEKYNKYIETTPEGGRVLVRGRSYMVLLQEESFASRFAVKVNRSLDREQLVKWFQTYAHAGYKSSYVEDKISFTDTVYKLIRRIEA
jgi:hypothetical protein